MSTESTENKEVSSSAPLSQSTPVSTSTSSGKKSKDKAGRKKKVRRHVSKIKVHILASFNNTIVTVTDSNGATLSACSAGEMGFKGSRKSTPFAAQVVTEKALNTAKELHGFTDANIYVDGPGPGRDSGIRTVKNFAHVHEIHDVTSVPHNGCKPPKERRV